ncbi:MAG: potassium-transporting ATPase subunit F [Planctomycetes bacterium]|nr:potassium-transporting ATPase subunit F [Planctomycetota bacterium]
MPRLRYFNSVTRTEGVHYVGVVSLSSSQRWLCLSMGINRVDREIPRCLMNVVVVLVIVLSFFYLTYAMLNPEKF